METIIAIDAMGGDIAPYSPVKASRLAGDFQDLKIILVGDEKKISFLMSGEEKSYTTVLHCDKHISMKDGISRKLLREKENTMRKVLSLVGEKKSDCALSAGNTAAFVSIAISELGLLQNVARPAIAVLLPNVSGSFSIFLDVGANILTKPEHFVQYGLMGSLYAEKVFGIVHPKVGLLNVGTESTKGGELRRQAFNLLSASQKINFIGNIEGQDLFTGKVHVVVSDGFTGNVVLKVSEGILKTFKTDLKREFSRNILGKIGSFILKGHFKRFTGRVDYAEYGGGLLLGVNGVVIISHGKSSPRAILSAIKLGKKIIENNFLQTLQKELNKI